MARLCSSPAGRWPRAVCTTAPLLAGFAAALGCGVELPVARFGELVGDAACDWLSGLH